MIIDYNPSNLNKKDISEKEEKVRLLIKNDKDDILVANYGGAYLLPGGKIDDNESIMEALVREIKEEVGIGINESLIKPIAIFKYYQKDYPKRNGKKLNRLITTHYYEANINIDLNKYKRCLTKKEIADNFKLEWIKKDKLKDVILNNPDIKQNPRINFINNELIKILDLYNDTYKKLDSIGHLKNKPYVDMHMHSIYSDGELTPNELIKKAYENNIGIISITDHDTLLGLKNITHDFDEACYVKVIPGIELSAKVQKGRMHILGYDFDIDDKSLNDKMKEIRNNSMYSVIALINQLKIDYDIMFDSKDIKELFSLKGNIGRPNVAKLLVKEGYVKSVQESFDKYLISAYKKTRTLNRGLSYEECIKLIKDAGGISVLAHPNQLKMDNEELEETIKNMIDCGLDGIEVYHSGHTKEETKRYLELSKKYNLLVSAGSDYHGKMVKPDVEIGVTSSGKIKKLSLLDKIKKR